MAYSAIGETSDGVVHLGLVGGGLQRIASSTRVCVAQLGSRLLYEVTAAVAAQTAPTTAEVQCIHRDGWAMALDGTRIELWRYSGGTWSLAAEGDGVEINSYYRFQIVFVEGDLYVVDCLSTTDENMVWVRRGAYVQQLAGNEAWPAALRLTGVYGSRILWRGIWGLSGGGDFHHLHAYGAENPDLDLALPHSGLTWLGMAQDAGALQVTLWGTGLSSVPDTGYWVWWDGRARYYAAIVDLKVRTLASGQGGRVWGVGGDGYWYLQSENDRLFVTEGIAGGVWVYAVEVDGVVGLQVVGTGDADGWYAPGDPVNGQPSYVSEDGDWWIIWDGTQWILAPYGETGGGYTTVLDGTTQNLVVTGAADASCDGEYAPGAEVNGQPSWDQVDGDHSILWDGTQWALVDGDGEVIYTDGSGDMPWQGLWTDAEGEAGPTVAGRMAATEELLAPGAGEHVRWLRETDADERAVAARLTISAPAADLAQMRALVRYDSTADLDEWTTYQVMPLAPATATPDTPATTVEVAIIKPTTVGAPDVELWTRRFEE